MKNIVALILVWVVGLMAGCGGGESGGGGTSSNNAIPATLVGAYNGSYTGSDSGTLLIDITAQGAVTNCTIISSQTGSIYTCTGTVNTSGSLTITSVTNSAVFSGTVSTSTAGTRQISGAWTNALGFSGTFSGTIAPSAKAITAFLLGGVAGIINETNKTITVTVPLGTSVTALATTFTTTGSSVKVGSTVQVSGTTVNDFTNPVSFAVTAADTTTINYTVTVTVAP